MRVLSTEGCVPEFPGLHFHLYGPFNTVQTGEILSAACKTVSKTEVRKK